MYMRFFDPENFKALKRKKRSNNLGSKISRIVVLESHSCINYYMLAVIIDTIMPTPKLITHCTQFLLVMILLCYKMLNQSLLSIITYYKKFVAKMRKRR